MNATRFLILISLQLLVVGCGPVRSDQPLPDRTPFDATPFDVPLDDGPLHRQRRPSLVFHGTSQEREWTQALLVDDVDFPARLDVESGPCRSLYESELPLTTAGTMSIERNGQVIMYPPRPPDPAWAYANYVGPPLGEGTFVRIAFQGEGAFPPFFAEGRVPPLIEVIEPNPESLLQWRSDGPFVVRWSPADSDDVAVLTLTGTSDRVGVGFKTMRCIVPIRSGSFSFSTDVLRTFDDLPLSRTLFAVRAERVQVVVAGVSIDVFFVHSRFDGAIVGFSR